MFPSASSSIASKRRVQLDGSSDAVAMGTGFGPGLMAPVTASPSQSNTSSRRVRLSSSGPQSPLHEPLRGWPYCAGAATAPSPSNAPTSMQNAVRMVPSILAMIFKGAPTKALRATVSRLGLPTLQPVVKPRVAPRAARRPPDKA